MNCKSKKSYKNYFSLFCIFFMMFLGACSQKHHENPEQHQSQSIDSLKRLVDFPFSIKSAQWQISTRNNENGLVPGPNDYSICAEIEFFNSDLNTLKTKLGQNNELSVTEVHLSQNSIEKWLSPGAKKIFFKEGDYITTKVSAYKLNNQIVGSTFFSSGFFCFINDKKALIFLDK